MTDRPPELAEAMDLIRTAPALLPTLKEQSTRLALIQANPELRKYWRDLAEWVPKARAFLDRMDAKL